MSFTASVRTAVEFDNMRLGIDGQPFLGPFRTGLYFHLYYLLQELSKLGTSPIRLFVNETEARMEDTQRREIARAFPRLILTSWRRPVRLYRVQTWLSSLRRINVFFHNESSAFSPLAHAANIYLIPDLIPLFIEYPDPHLRSAKLQLCDTAIQHGDAVITYSAHSKQDIVKVLDIDESNVHVIPLAAGPQFRRIEDKDALTARLGALGLRDTPYILYVSTIEPRKNHLALVQAYARLRQQDRAIPHKLVLVGPKWLGHEPVFDAISRLGLDAHVIHFEKVDELETLYNGADAFVFPSLYEGFGLPILEAMACGTPVVASNVTASPEVVGDAGLLVDPRDESALCDSIRRLLTDADLRSELVARGLRRAATFSWTRTAERTLDICCHAYARFRAEGLRRRASAWLWSPKRTHRKGAFDRSSP